jgi:hypothetical protein
MFKSAPYLDKMIEKQMAGQQNQAGLLQKNKGCQGVRP